LTGKRNIEKVLAILEDYKNLEDEVKDLEQKIKGDNEAELFHVYKKLKIMSFLHQKLVRKVE